MDQLTAAPDVRGGVVVTVKTSPVMPCVRRALAYQEMADWCRAVGIVETDFAEALATERRFFPTFAVRFARADDAEAFKRCWMHALATG